TSSIIHVGVFYQFCRIYTTFSMHCNCSLAGISKFMVFFLSLQMCSFNLVFKFLFVFPIWLVNSLNFFTNFFICLKNSKFYFPLIFKIHMKRNPLEVNLFADLVFIYFAIACIFLFITRNRLIGSFCTLLSHQSNNWPFPSMIFFLIAFYPLVDHLLIYKPSCLILEPISSHSIFLCLFLQAFFFHYLDYSLFSLICLLSSFS
ncbi:hypothetical protein L9F63_004700, partial [Diploptera punctata]